MSAGSSAEEDPPDDLASFVVFSNPGPFEFSESLQHVEAGQSKAKLKHRLLSAWNNLKYGGWSLKSKPRLSKSAPVWLLGRTYSLSSEGEREQFRQVFSSLLWLTYRRKFAPLSGSSLTSDCGWGCMLRSAQMLLAQGLHTHTMPEGWTWSGARHQIRDDLEVGSPRSGPGVSSRQWRRRSEGSILESVEDREERTHRRLVAMFGDTPSAPFSIHQLVELGKPLGKRAGDWYGPSTAALILREAVAASNLTDLTVYVAQDCTVYVEDVMRRCGGSQSEGNTSVIILVPIRLGGDSLNPAYIECVKKLLQLKCCIGVMGGEPKHSLYFVGFQGEKLLYLDPHVCHSTVDVCKDRFPLESFHCKAARKVSFHRMDPSCTLGFYTRDRKDFDSLRADVTRALTSSNHTYPIFTFVEGSREKESGQEWLTTDTIANIPDKHRSRGRKKPDDMDGFVLL
ncbi:cysteine protease ATG4D-like isoform X1 [Astyanax mexicanus]|uniref:Cysteine protease n=1 Tax=Astyanax mexicanus TaxID=7994 RepID=A0A8T2MEH1_ASTMX|nr:cysteine protease ATG4D-like isoform X1 [Astyanax mexicanus]